MKLKWKFLGDKQYQAISLNKKYDFVVDGRKPQALIVFDNSIENNDQSLVEIVNVSSIKDAKNWAENYK